MLIPTSIEEIKEKKWEYLDIILVSGDTYIDSPNDGIVIIGKVLLNAGFRVGIIAQPDINTDTDIKRLGEPRLFWGISAGCVDSMVANYTALKKRKKYDDLTPGGFNNKRPDRAVIAYTNLIKKYYKNKKPIIIGGIESSLRRIAHYDYWSNKVRRSIIFDSKADILVYGMGEKTILEIAHNLSNNISFKNIRGICYISNELPNNLSSFIYLPDFENVCNNKDKFIEMFNIFYKNNDAINAKGLIQRYERRYLIQNPPNYPLNETEIDEIYNYKYERIVHPYYQVLGKVNALDTIKFSITTHRGCFGECNFCSIAVHQGRRIISRSTDSIINEIKYLSKLSDFKGYISDIGGPTANMYKMQCNTINKNGSCQNKKCLTPEFCRNIVIDHNPLLVLLNKINKIKTIKKCFIGSGIRYDLIMNDKINGIKYLEKIIEKHISGQMKIAPEHISKSVLKSMGKPANIELNDFIKLFYNINRKNNKKQFLTYYFIAAHPECNIDNMKELNEYIKKYIKITPEQIQIFTPTPSTYSTLMYFTKKNPFTNKEIFIEYDNNKKELQKKIIIKK